MLGVGSHSYGFMNSAFHWLIGFAISQAIFMLLGMLPPQLWRSQVANPRTDRLKADSVLPRTAGELIKS